MMLIFDGHLDIAYNALTHERDPLLSVDQTRSREADPPCEDDGRGRCTTSLAEMREAGVAVALTTVLARCKPWVKPGRARRSIDAPTPAMTHAIGQAHLAYYRELERQGHVTILETRQDLQQHWQAWEDAAAQPAEGGAVPGARPGKPPVGLVLTMEGADPITEPSQLQRWYGQGLRTLSLTHFGMGRYAAGNPASLAVNPMAVGAQNFDVDGPVSPLGVELLAEMSRLGMSLDLTHTSDTSFFDALGRFDGPVYASHANCRAISDTQRQFTDEMLRAIIERGGVIGVVLALNMVRADLIDGDPWHPRSHRVTLEHLADHVDHICQLAGNTRHAAIGSDTDGGFGREACPHGYDRHRDLHKLADILRARGYADADVAGIMHGNWLRFHGETLPTG